MRNFSLFRQEYVQLYVDTIRPLLLDEDPTRPYVVSSPSNGLKSEEDGFIALNPYSDLYGDGTNTPNWFSHPVSLTNVNEKYLSFDFIFEMQILVQMEKK